MHYYIDGYNLLFKTATEGSTLKTKREFLLSQLNLMSKELKLDLTVVFDGSIQEERGHFHNLEVIYTGKESADHYILKQIEFSKNPSKETVITSDRELALLCKRYGAQILSIKAFFKMKRKKKKKEERDQQKAFEESSYHFKRLLKIFEKKLKEKD